MANEPVVRAPELPRDLVWLNTKRPLSLRELRGHVVILDFWTYCCINCMHVIPLLDALEERHRGDPLVVIGVHSAKFDEEKDPTNIRDAIARYGLHHPVVVDQNMKVWNDFAIRSWPTLVVIRPDGTIAAVAPGEPDPAVLEEVVKKELDQARARGTLAREPLRIELAENAQSSGLSFPGKIAVAPDGRIAVSDSGHHRVLLLDGDGNVLETIDSDLDDPQGLCFDPSGELLFIADVRSHTVVRAELRSGATTVIAGTGALGSAPLRGEHGAREVMLRSPWDVAFARGRRPEDAGDVLYVALAGSHQIAAIDLQKGTLSVVAGTGAESMIDGPFAEATFSQPSGLSWNGNDLWVADSETSSVRVLDFHRKSVRTLVGVGLFDFGDEDGSPHVARLQHCLGVTLMGSTPIVADTYNHKLKQVDPRTGEVLTLFRGSDGLILREPGGVAWDAHSRRFLVADTGHHRLVEVSPDGGRARVLEIVNAPPRAARRRSRVDPPPPARSTSWYTAVVDEATPLAPGEGTIDVILKASPGLHFASKSRVRMAVDVSRRSDLLVAATAAYETEIEDVDCHTAHIPVMVRSLPADAIASEVLLTIDCITCSDGGIGSPAACTPIRAHVRLPVRLARDGTSRAAFQVPVRDEV